MRSPNALLDRAAGRLAHHVLTWGGRQLAPARRVWIEGLRAELDVIPGGGAQLRWALGGLGVLWTARRDRMTNASPTWATLRDTGTLGVALGALEAALLVAWRDVPDAAVPWRGVVAGLVLGFALVGLLAGWRTG